MVGPAGRRLADILEVFTGFEPDGAARRNPHFLARPGVAPDPALAWLDLEDAEASKLDAVATLHGEPHGVEYRIDGHLSLHFGDVRNFRDFVDDVDLNHEPSRWMTVTTIRIAT